MTQATDILTSVKTLLSSNWNSTNTDGITPEIEHITEFKRILGDDQSVILLYSVSYEQGANGIGKDSKFTEDVISCDIRTTIGRPHVWKLKEEVTRIFDDNVLGISMGDSLELKRMQDLSNKAVKLYRFIVDVQISSYNVSR